MKRLTKIVFSILILIPPLLFIKVIPTYAQPCGAYCGSGGVCDQNLSCDLNGRCSSQSLCESCIGDNGEYGACFLNCPAGWINGFGNCPGGVPRYPCCSQPTQCPPGGTLGCGETCTEDSECLSGLRCDPASQQCYGTVCSTGIGCSTCTGNNSHRPGVCIPESDCRDVGGRLVEQECWPWTTHCCTNWICYGRTTNLYGLCYFFECPPELPVMDGMVMSFTPPTITPGPSPTGFSPLPGVLDCSEPQQFPVIGNVCCVALPTTEIVPRPNLDPNCSINGEEGINTAIGCIPVTSQTSFLMFVLPWTLGVGGGTAFVLIIVGGFLFMTSGGNPQRAKAGKEILTSAIIGLLMLIFSVYILDLIGLRIFNIPGL